jgi:hypothetical protein
MAISNYAAFVLSPASHRQHVASDGTVLKDAEQSIMDGVNRIRGQGVDIRYRRSGPN